MKASSQDGGLLVTALAWGPEGPAVPGVTPASLSSATFHACKPLDSLFPVWEMQHPGISVGLAHP